MEEKVTNREVYHTAWLWTLRISVVIALLPLLTVSIIPAIQFIPQVIPPQQEKAWTLIGLALVLLLPLSAILPYLMILWRVCRKPPRESALALAVVVGSWWYSFCSALSFIWFIDRATLSSHPPADQMGIVWLCIGSWLVIGIPHSVLLISAMKTVRFPNQERSVQLESQADWQWIRVARVALVTSALFLLAPNLFLSPVFKRVMPTTGVALIGLMVLAAEVPYLFTFAWLRKRQLNRLIADLGTGLASGWVALFAMASLLSSLARGQLLSTVHLGWTLPAFWVPFGITLAILLVSSWRIRHLTRTTEGGDAALWNTLIPSSCFIFLLVVFTIYVSGE